MKKHVPVMLNEVLEYVTKIKERFPMIVDVTLGYGGNSAKIYELLKQRTGGFLLSIDWDKEAVDYVFDRFKEEVAFYFTYTPQEGLKKVYESDGGENVAWAIVHGNFAYIQTILSEVIKELQHEKHCVDLVLADLGVSSPQLEDKKRGFSFASSSASLDMRMDPDTYNVKAYDLLNFLSRNELKRLFEENVGMPSKFAASLAWEIEVEREKKPFGDKDDVVRIQKIANKVLPLRKSSLGRLNLATLVFLALRMAVNMELDNLRELLENLPHILCEKGTALIIAFHSGEWRIIEEKLPHGMGIDEVVVPTRGEIRENPKARSAKMYVLSRT